MRLWCLVACLVFGSVVESALREAFWWRGYPSFEWPSDAEREHALATGAYRPESVVPVGLEVWGGRVFVTVPRWSAGVPASLAVFPVNASSASPSLAPYPDWASHNASSQGWGALPSRLVSPFRVRADRCGRLWVLDTGRADLLGDAQTLAPAALLVFDLRTDTLLRRFDIPRAQLSDASFLVNVAVDVSPLGCEQTFAYVADMGAYALLVYSWAADASWRVTHNYFLSHPLQGEFHVRGAAFQWVDGLFGLALSKPNRYHHRTLYFHAFASTAEFQVSTEILQNETRATNSFHEFHLVGDRGPNTQSCASFMDEESGIVFYTQVNRDAITCWNSRKRPHYQPSTIGLVAQDNQTLVFPNDVKVDEQRNLWVLSDRLPLFIYSSLDASDVNFRILTASVEEAVNGTICDPAYSGPEPALEEHPLGARFGQGSPCLSAAPAAHAPFALAPLAALLALAR